MTWRELLYRLKGIPEEEMDEKATFVILEAEGKVGEAWEIDDIDSLTRGDIEAQGIYDENDSSLKKQVLTP